MAPTPIKRDYSVASEFVKQHEQRSNPAVFRARVTSPEPHMNRPVFQSPLESAELSNERPGTPDTVLLDVDSDASDAAEQHAPTVIHASTHNDMHSMDGRSEPSLDIGQLENDDMRPMLPAKVLSKSTLSGSVRSGSVTMRDTTSDSSSSSRLPEFFSSATFHAALSSPTIAHQLQKFADARLAGENMAFLSSLVQYHIQLDDLTKSIARIHKDFICNSGTRQVNIDALSSTKTNFETKLAASKSLPQIESIFAAAQTDVERLMYADTYPKFVQHQMSVSAAKALAGDRSKYAGLGDCFVLTDPNKADNPILYASDGFVNVTGFNRSDIIPRNCRFLQGKYSNQASVRRLKTAIHQNQESVELLINQKRDGTPFMNLLYTTPLFTQGQDKPVFFLGGQINCSTTIHSTSDVLRVLAQSEDDDKTVQQNTSVAALKQRKSSGILNAFRSRAPVPVPARAPGMETTILNKMEHMTTQHQVSSFYTAYSHYIVINHSTYLIGFISSRLVDLLFPINVKAKSASDNQIVGTDVFKFLANHGTGNIGRDLKSTVKGALKAGRPISVDVKLCARPLMGFERFSAHFTPLKDEHSAVQWIVLTLGNEQRVGLAY